MAATRRRWVAGAAGQSVRNATTVAGSAGSSQLPVAWHQSVNRAQSPAYARTVRGASIRPPLVAEAVVVMAVQRPMRVTALPISGACSRA